MDLTELREQLNVDYKALDIRLFDIAGTPITLVTLIALAIILILTFAVSWILQRALHRALSARKVDAGTEGVVRRLAHYGVIAVGLGVGLQTIGINLAALFAAGAVFAIGLGFAMQNLAQNFVSGLILLIERAIKPGDVLEIEGKFVRVVGMGIRATIARTLDDEEIIIPNSTIVQSTVKNFTLRDSVYRLRSAVGVVYGSDMRLVRRVLEEAAAGLSWRLADRAPVVLLLEFGDSSVNFEVSVWIEDPWTVRQRRSQLNEAVWWALKDAGVTIAFPQLDVHFDPPVMESLHGLGRTG